MADRDSGSSVPPDGDIDPDGALSRAFLLRRGFCCELGCKNCPYRQQPEADK